MNDRTWASNISVIVISIVIGSMYVTLATQYENYHVRIEIDFYERYIDKLLETHNISIEPVTFRDVILFLAIEKTDDKTYINETYTCRHFGSDVVANATSYGIRCGYVALEYESGKGHVVVAFDTTNFGTIYIEPQSDGIVFPVVGEKFDEKTIKDIYTIWNDFNETNS